MIDETHHPQRRSWVPSANGHPDFPIQNLPFCVFAPPGGGPARGGVAIGDHVLDLSAALAAGRFSDQARVAAEAAAGTTLNPLMRLAAAPRRALRRQVSALLDAAGPDAGALAADPGALLHPIEACRFAVPAAIGDYTDFYAGIHHALNVGRLFRPDDPLLPNYKHVPIGYHGRSSTIRTSGAAVRRPWGQRKPPTAEAPSFEPSQNLDYELELGIWIGGESHIGESVPIAEAGERLFGLCLLNDWSARDVQAWEYQPLGPFLAKNFATTISPFVVTMEALEPFRSAQTPRAEGDPRPLPYLYDPEDQARGAFDIELEVMLRTATMRDARAPAQTISRCNARALYWTAAQLVAHHASGGCDLNPGDLFGTGTISTADPDHVGSLLELTQGGRRPFTLADGETRRFLEDGDEVSLRGRCRREGFVQIGFGDCSGVVTAAA